MEKWSEIIFVPFVETWHRARRFKLKELFCTKRSVNFIHIHVLYILTLTIVGSVMIYGARNMPYIDALFFSTGSATQSGLGTLDVNNIELYQQIVMFSQSFTGNIVLLHSSVVFVRLFWFERRFSNLVKEAKLQRRTMTRTRSRMRTVGSMDSRIDEESGLRGRSTSGVQRKQPNGTIDPLHPSTEPSGEEKEPIDEVTLLANQDIRFDSLPHPSGDGLARSPDEHIRFLQDQRDRKNQDGKALRIPGPKEYDLGHTPQALEDETVRLGLNRQTTAPLIHRPSWGIRALSSKRGRSSTSRALEMKGSMDGNQGEVGHNPDSRPTAQGNGAISSGRRWPAIRSRLATAIGTIRSWKARGSRSEPQEAAPYLSWTPTIGRNSAFTGLNRRQREELGGIEYRALKTLAWILVWYFFASHIFGWITFTAWIMRADYYGLEIVEGAAGAGRPWWGIFTPTSHLTDTGYALTSDSMNSFNEATFPLLIGGFLVIIGNTGFPIMLRFIIWVLWKLTPEGTALCEELHFLLDHPRRCFTLLFPSKATWWLFWVLVVLNVTDLLFFIVLDINDPTVTAIPPGYRVLDGLYQAVSTRTAGFSVINLAALHPGIQVSYLVMMYVSVLPIAISMRRTNVYEKNSLGIYDASNEEEDDDELTKGKEGKNETEGKGGKDRAEPSYVAAHLRKQLSFDLWFVFLGLFIIAISEGSRIADPNQPSFTLFAVLFEIVSAYGTVGLSLGYPGLNASFSAEFGIVAKLVIIATMFRGRHRGLPYALDKAILLPSEKQMEKEATDAERRFLEGSRTSIGNGSAPRGRRYSADNATIPAFRRAGSEDGGLGQRMHAIKEEARAETSGRETTSTDVQGDGSGTKIVNRGSKDGGEV